jgi:S-adenosylmethionine:tRNA ribosyltransferase-isomerase
MKTDDFDYYLPEELIAQTPLEKRDSSRLLVLDKTSGKYEDKHFYDVVDYLNKGDVLVRNNTRVIPARIFGIKQDTGAHVEVLLLKQIEDTYECLVGNARVVKVGTVINFADKLKATCLKIKDEGIRILKFECEGIFLEVLNEIGNMPLPPYIKESLMDKDRYQTVYAKYNGSAAAPTAGLHFNDDVFKKLKAKGVEVVDVTLHVGLGTFRPVKVDDVTNHVMHKEEYFMSKESADVLNAAKKENRRIIAVGTTSTRVLETVMNKYGKFKECHEESDIFIYPGYEFKAIDALITNFHLPKSTLIMLVSALAKKENIMEAYKHAVEEKYRFFSFGDAMFIK